MDTIIGLGKAGCAIADKFAKFSQYETYKIDVGLQATPWSYPIEEHQKIEDYERKCPDMSEFFKDVQGEILFVVGGGGKISSSALSILQYLKKSQINVLYIKPELSFLGKEAMLLGKMVFNIFQEYARSGVFKRLYIIDNGVLEKVSSQASIKNYFDNLNESIVSAIHMINVFNHNDSITDTFSNPPAGARISTIGFGDPEKNEDHMFFLLDNVSDVVYYYAYNKMKLEEGNNLLTEIKDSIREKIAENVRVSYGIFETTYEDDYIYCINHSSTIQDWKPTKNKDGGLENLPASP